MSESSAGPGNGMQMDQERLSKSGAVLTMTGLDHYISIMLQMTCH
jgi:hypothetical protein